VSEELISAGIIMNYNSSSTNSSNFLFNASNANFTSNANFSSLSNRQLRRMLHVHTHMSQAVPDAETEVSAELGRHD
jgi:hypothetical protein